LFGLGLCPLGLWPIPPGYFWTKNELSHGCGKRLAVERLWRTIGYIGIYGCGMDYFIQNIWAIIGVVLAIIAVAYQALQFHKGRKARVRQQIISGNNNRQSAHKDGDTEQRIEGGSHNVQDIQ
jgi:hypothetical protein